MAPQQNSTFIDDDSHLRSQLKGHPNQKDEEEEEIIKRYSPIPKELNFELNESENRADNNANDNNNKLPKEKQFLYNKRQATNKNELPKHLEKNNRQNYYNNNKTHRNRNGNTAQNCMNRRNRSVSVHGANSTMGEEQHEITIWINDEPRYVSGVTKRTTCNDIIKALIDDEIQNGNDALSRHKQNQQPNQHQHRLTKDGGDGVCATSRDYGDYVIAESWRGIERSYDGNIAILPIWKAWSRVNNELRLFLRHRNDIVDPKQCVKPHQTRPSLFAKYLSKLARLWRKTKPDTPHRSGGTSKILKMKENCLLSDKSKIPDEFLFVIMPDRFYEKKSSTPLQPVLEHVQKASKQCERYSRPSTRPPRSKSKLNRKKHERGVSGVSGNNCIRRRQVTSASQCMRNSIRYRLAQKTSEMDELYAREYALTRELSEKCKLYRQQNQVYSNPEQQWNISIGQVQRKIENYAQEIVRTEHELLELKNEIKQDISLINNLKRMTLERRENTNDRHKDPPAMLAAPQAPDCPSLHKVTMLSPVAPNTPNHLEGNKEMQFVDNIYEFCDNNASMLV